MTVTDPDRSAGVHAVLPEIPIFAFMPDDVRDLVVGSLEPRGYEFGQVIVREGEEPDAFYVMVSGTARALKATDTGDEVALETLHRGDSFGFVELIEGTPRTATVRASSQVSALRLDRGVFQALVRSNPRIREHFDLPVRMHHLRHFLRVDSAFGSLTGEALAILLREVRDARLPSGSFVYKEGQATGSLYVVRDGRARVSRTVGGKREDIAFLRRGDSFGEGSLLNGTPRAESVEAVSELDLLELPAGTYRRLLEADPGFRARIEEKISRHDFRERARVPLDFAEEILPAVSAVHQVVSPDQADAGAARAPAAEELQPGEAGAAKSIRKFPHVYQVDEADCGAACLAMVSRHFGREVSISHIRDLVATGTDGTSLAGIARGGEGLGLATRAVKASKSRLDDMPLPAVVHWEGNHWVVLYGVRDGEVKVADPALGLRKVPKDEFLEKWSGYAALVSYTPAFEQAPEGKSDMSWFWPFIRPHRRTLGFAAFLALLAAGLQFLIPVLTQVIVDDVIAKQDRDLLNTVAVALVVLIVLMVLVTVYQRYILSRAAVRIDGETLDYLTDKLLALPMRYFHSRRTGDIEQRLAGLRQVREFVVQSGVQALTAITQLVVAVVLMLLYSPLLTLVYLATVPLYVALMRYSRRKLRPMFDTLEESFGRYQSKQIDAIKGIETVKAMGAEPSLRRLLVKQFDTLADRVFRADFTIMTYEAMVSSVTLLSLGLFLYVGADQVLKGDLTIGELVAFNALVLLANAPIGLVLALWDQYQFSSILLNRMNDIFEQEPEQGADHSGLAAVPTLSGRISMRDVGFRYGGPAAPPILEGISIDVEPGTTVAIVGRSGSGKTTLVKCLAGLLEPTEGSIEFDGVDMRTISWRDLRRQIGFVLQESYLFDDTLAANIAFGSEAVDMEKVVWASRAAAAHEFVDRLPLGYDTRVGETGLLLSGGQKQRIAIARALYERPPVLVFDEATSSLDSESERAVKQSMDSLLSGRTSFVIAHRLSTIRDADVILVLEKGRLVEQGSHDELMARQGLYYYLSSQQLEL